MVATDGNDRERRASPIEVVRDGNQQCGASSRGCGHGSDAPLPPQPIICAHRPPKPLLLWDGECGFCARWAQRIQRLVGDRLDCVPYQLRLNDFPEIAAEHFTHAVFIVLPNGHAYHSAEAIYRALAVRRPLGIMLLLYRTCPVFARFSERRYRSISKSRSERN